MAQLRTRTGNTTLSHAELDANFKRTVTQKTTTYQILISDNRSIIEGNHASSAFTITLPPVATADNSETGDFEVTVTNINAAIVTVDGSGAETIDDTANLALQQWASATFALDSAQTGWKVTSKVNILNHVGALTVSGAFTSTGIDDNATGERVQISDTQLQLGDRTTAGEVYGIAMGAVTTGRLDISGGTNTAAGGVIQLYGGTHSTQADDVQFSAAGNVWGKWDESAGSFVVNTGVGSKTLALTLDSSQDATFAGDVNIATSLNVEAYSEDADQYTATTGTRDLDTALATYFYPSADLGTATITFTFSNPASSGRVTSFTLELLGADGATLTWPAAVDWANGTEPTWGSGVDIVSFITRDGGTTWLGFLGGQAFA